MSQDERVARIWDGLADFDAAQAEAACRYLMESLAGLVEARNVGWVGGMRTAVDCGDSMGGWRVGALSYLHDEPLNVAAVAELKVRWSRREVDPLSLRSIDGAGEMFRGFTLREVMDADWFDQPYYKHLYEGRDVYDALMVFFPVNRDAESVFVLHRGAARGSFAADDLALAMQTLRGVKWFHRRLLLGHGLLVASAPLSPAERRALSELLTEASEKEIARRLELAPSTVHQYATAIYRKFGVKGRAGLMSLWLNRMG